MRRFHPLGSPRLHRGQAVPIIAMAFLVIMGFAGLAIDGVHVYLVKRQAQNAADGAALAAGRWLVVSGSALTAPPSSSTESEMTAAHDLAGANGFPTAGSGCDSRSATQFTTAWYDNGTCGSTDFNVRVVVNDPPTGPLPVDCQSVPYNCLQVIATQKVPSFIMGVLGIPYTYVSASATVLAQPAGPQIGTPPAVALYLYEPTSAACPGGQQCYNPANPPARSQLSCQNCPTFWASQNAGPVIAAIDGTNLTGRPNEPAAQTNGDMLLQDDTTFCDPYGGLTCKAGQATGADGFGIAPGASLYCTGFGAGSNNGLTSCSSNPYGTGRVFGNEVPFASALWSPTVYTNSLPSCGTLVLNGDTVANSLKGASSACVPPANEPYIIEPGIYKYIEINHGTYEFEAGLYDITGVADNSAISHGNETAADFDLCAGITGCKPAAGIWIGHGNNSYVAGQSAKLSCLGTGSSGGGGDQTNVTGTGVTFRFESGSAGFVSTHEVQSIWLAAPGLGASMQYTAGAPLLFDMENNGTIHLDSQPPNKGKSSGFSGLVYQTKNATAGGVEINPALAGASAALTGQVLAYSFNTFGARGPAIDFSQGFGTASSPIINTSSHNETEIMNPAPQFKDLGNGIGQLIIHYTDEWALDGYDAYVKINGGNAIFFSQGIWNTPNPNSPPPDPNTPGDSNPAYPSSTQDVSNQYQKVWINNLPDWTYKFQNGSTFEVSGNWTWGHEADIGTSGTNSATLTYTFAAPPGQTVDVSIFMTDGDHCGDYVSASYTFKNVAYPDAGQQASGSVLLLQ